MDLNPLFETIFFPELDTDPTDAELSQPLGEFIEHAQLAAELRKSGGDEPAWDDEIVGTDSSAKKVTDIDLGKRSSGPGKLKPFRTKVEDGETMIEFFNSRGECVSTSFVRE